MRIMRIQSLLGNTILLKILLILFCLFSSLNVANISAGVSGKISAGVSGKTSAAVSVDSSTNSSTSTNTTTDSNASSNANADISANSNTNTDTNANSNSSSGSGTNSDTNKNTNPTLKIIFPDWRLSQAQEQADTLKKEAGNLSDDEIKRSLQRGKEAFQKKDWSEAISEYARAVGHDLKNREAWLKLSLALQHKNNSQENWKTDEAAKLSALNLYLISKTPEEQAEALLVYGNNLRPDDEYEAPSYTDVFETVQALTDISKLKENRLDLANLMTFRFEKIEVNNQASPPSVCFNFSHAIPTQNIHYEDYFSIHPKVDGVLKASGRALCFSPLQFGVTYDVILKAGIKDNYGERLPADVKLSFRVKDQPSLLSFKTRAYVLRKEEQALIPLSGVNVDAVNIKILRINDRGFNQAVGPSNDFLTRLWDYSVDQIENVKGELLYQGTMDFSKSQNEPISKNETMTKLIPFSSLVKKTEPGLYVVQADEKGTVIGNRATATQWVIVSDLGLTTFSQSDGGIWVNVRSLGTADPLSGVELKLLAYNNSILKSVTTNKEGMAFFDPTVTKGKGGNRPLMVLAYGSKDDFSFLTLDQPAFDLSDRGVSGRKLSGAVDAFLYTEQGVYRPGDKVHVNTLLRDEKGNAKGGLPLTFRVLRSDEVLISEQTITGNDLGFYELMVPLQGSSRTGNWTVLAYLDPKKDPIGRIAFSVEDFVPSRITVKLTTDEKLLQPKQTLPVHILAKYLFGAPAGGLVGEGSLTLRARPNPYPKWPGYRFGLITDPFKDSKTALSLNPLDKDGKGTVSVEVDKLPDTSLPLEAVIRVNLSDKGGRPEIGTLKLPVQATTFKIGIKPAFGTNANSANGANASNPDNSGNTSNSASNNASKTDNNGNGDNSNQSSNLLPDTENNAVFEVIAIDEQQQTQAIDKLEYELYEERPRYTWYQADKYSPWQYQTRLEDKFLARGTVATRKDTAQKLSLPVVNWGQYRLEIRDPKTNIATSIRFNKGYETSGDSSETPDKITVRVSQDRIAPKGTVELQIDSPFEGQALLTIANNKILETRNIKISTKGTRLKLTATEDWGVGVYCLVSAFRPITENFATVNANMKESANNSSANNTSTNKVNSNNANSKPFLPKRAIGLAWVGIDPSARVLNIAFELPAEVKPRQTLSIPLTVTQNGKALAGKTQIAIAAVDEGILKLTDFTTPKPQDYFFGKHRLSIELRDLYGKLIDPMPGALGELRVGGDAGLLSRNLQALSKRSFKVVSLYKGLVDLDKNGKGQFQLELPDFNGSLRLMAVAFSEKSLGSKEAALLVRDPIVVEGVMPRFLAPNDKSRLSLSLNNVQATAGKYQLQYSVKGPLKIQGDKGLLVTQTSEVTLALNEAKDLELPIVAESVGDASITVKLTGNGLNIQRTFEISIRPGQPYQMFSKSQVLKSGEQAKIDVSAQLNDFVPNTIEALLSFSSTVPWDTQAIFKRLADYPYGSVEQSTSKGLGALYQSALYQSNDDSNNGSNNNANNANSHYIVNQIIAGLSEKQQGSGSYALWNTVTDSGDVFLTAYVMDFLLRTQEQNVPIPKYTLERGLDWLSRMIDRREYNDYALTETSYALYVLTKANRIETGALRYFFDTYFKDMRNPIARAFIGTALAKRGDIARVKEAYGKILDSQNKYYSSKSYDSPYGTELRDRLVLLTMMRETLEAMPSFTELTDIVNALMPTIQKEIQPSTTATSHLSTQELAWAVLSAASMENERRNPGQTNLSPNIEVKFNDTQYSEPGKNYSLPIASYDLSKGLTVKNEGKMTLWQNLLISGLPKDMPKAASSGIEIQRQYFSLEGEKLSVQEVKQGKQIVVVIEGSVQDDLPHQLLVVDFLPAGFEIENARLGQNGLSDTFSWLKEPTKADYTESRDDRFVGSILLDKEKKAFRLAYVVRAVTPGTYQSPGLYVEDMYAPNYFARTDAESIQITPR